MYRLASIAGALGAACLLASPSGAQAARRPSAGAAFPRPRLEANADTNDWEAYYDRGVALLQQRKQVEATPYFYWAARIDPSRGEPPFASYVTFWAHHFDRYMRRNEPDERAAPDARAADSLRDAALQRNPLVYQGLNATILGQLQTVEFSDDPSTQAWLNYALLRFDRADELLRRAIARDTVKYAGLRYERALVYTAQQRYDSAAAQLRALIATLGERQAREMALDIESNAFYQYALGRLLFAQNDLAGAADAFRRALEEDLAFAPAHEWLAEVALRRGDVPAAVTEFAQALETRPGDAVLHWKYGRALAAAGRDPDAEEQFRAAIFAEPWYADPYFSLALALDRQGHADDAVTAYGQYLDRAAAKAPNAERARARLHQLMSK